MKTVITYGTFDLLHVGHINLLKRARALGDRLIVALSTDEFNQKMKNKISVVSYRDRRLMLESLRFVDFVIPENSWEQKITDIHKYSVDTFVMGHDWEGHFDHLQALCEVVYLKRTDNVSTTLIKEHLRIGSENQIEAYHEQVYKAF